MLQFEPVAFDQGVRHRDPGTPMACRTWSGSVDLKALVNLSLFQRVMAVFTYRLSALTMGSLGVPPSIVLMIHRCHMLSRHQKVKQILASVFPSFLQVNPKAVFFTEITQEWDVTQQDVIIFTCF